MIATSLLYREKMLILKVEKDQTYYRNVSNKLRRVMKNYPIHVDIIQKRGIIYLISLDDGFSVAFLYSAYLKAKKKGLKASLMYARHINEDWIPKEVRRLAEKWLSMRLSKSTIKLLKKLTITEYMIRRWCS